MGVVARGFPGGLLRLNPTFAYVEPPSSWPLPWAECLTPAPNTIALISHASKGMLKILQARLQQYVNRELPDVQAGFKKAEEPEIKLPTSTGSWKKQESSRKPSISVLLTMPKPLTVWITINCGKFWKGWEYQTTCPASWETCMQVRNNRVVPNRKRSTSKLYIVTLLI